MHTIASSHQWNVKPAPNQNQPIKQSNRLLIEAVSLTNKQASRFKTRPSFLPVITEFEWEAPFTQHHLNRTQFNRLFDLIFWFFDFLLFRAAVSISILISMATLYSLYRANMRNWRLFSVQPQIFIFFSPSLRLCLSSLPLPPPPAFLHTQKEAALHQQRVNK